MADTSTDSRFSKTMADTVAPFMKATFRPQHLFEEKDYAVVLLNQNIKLNTEVFIKIWNNARIRLVVDGGCNHFFSFYDSLPATLQETFKFPELLSGDFDSITDESMDRMKHDKKSKCQIILTEDQDETDFTKALRILHGRMKTERFSPEVAKVIVICEFAGRLDQTLGNLNTLHKNVFLQDKLAAQGATTDTDIYLMGSSNLCWLLPANFATSIQFLDDVPNLTCGLVPFTGPTVYVSSGLKWDLSRDMICNFGGLISTNNIVIKKNVEITSFERHSIFTLEIDQNKFILPLNY